MIEEFLQYIWKFQLYNSTKLQLKSGESVEIIKPGTQNFDSGPDFFNGQIRIGKTIWAGNIEIHINSSDWYKHNHHEDRAYSKIILHVVWEDDKKVSDDRGNPISTLELKGLISKSLLDSYQNLKNNQEWIPCSSEIMNINKITLQQSIESKLIERLETKTIKIDNLLEQNINSWEAVLYQNLARYFGFKVNSVPFELLAKNTSYSIIQKIRHNSFQLNALLFGQAGFLDRTFKDSYPNDLKKDYRFLQKKFKINSLEPSIWKFMRMRPLNFPTIRIAQFGALLNKHTNLFQKIIETNTIDNLTKLFEIQAESYWDEHYQFDKASSKNHKKNLGQSSINILLINVIVPILFNYGQKTGNSLLQDKSISFLESLPAETNTIIRSWNSIGIKSRSAFDSQALIQLKTVHCDSKNCLNCTIGNTILKRQKND